MKIKVLFTKVVFVLLSLITFSANAQNHYLKFEKTKEFDETGVPWSNVVAFVGHQKPEFAELTELIHDQGTLCIMGTSRNLDLKFSNGEVNDIRVLDHEYRNLLNFGIDVIETDIPVPLSKILPLSDKKQ